MNAIIFLAGCGTGALASCGLFIWVLCKSTSKPSKAQAEFNKITEDLLRERNAINLRIAEAIEGGNFNQTKQ